MAEAEADKNDSRHDPALEVAPGPHTSHGALNTRRMMLDVIIALVPVIVVALAVFRIYAVKQIVLCVVSCVAAEALFEAMRRRRPRIDNLSAVVTGLILALSLPGAAPWYVAVVGSAAGIGLGKAVFGGLGQNIFNPAMVGRAFVMICFASAMGSSAYQDAGSEVDAITQATPLTAMEQTGEAASLTKLFVGNTNGSLGETSALACLLGGLYLLVRRSAAWQIPAGVLLGTALLAALQNILNPEAAWTVAHHLLGGALLFGAFYIATDPVSSPLTPKGRFIFGLGVGALVMLLRVFSGYPEGVMFAVLLMNSVTPLINRWTIPRPVGGPVQQNA
ncbi:MAG: RnfABCDGE type electron transport complex subunit D [Phycisphaerae bacterium]